jgi:hypothetical protein
MPIFSLRINLNITANNEGAIIIGTSINEKSIRFPGKIRLNKVARRKPKTSSITVATIAKINVNLIELQKFGSAKRFL